MLKIFKLKILYTATALIFVSSMTGCYIERDVNPLKPWRAEAIQKTIEVEIPFARMNAGIGRHSQSQLKEAIDRAASKTKDYIYARIKIRHLQKSLEDPFKDPRVAKVIKFLKREGFERQRIEVIEDENLKFTSFNLETGMWVGIDYYSIKPLRCPGFDRQVMDGRVPPEGESHFGCTSESNFAAMIAEPRDLHHGHDLIGNDPVLSSNAIERLRTDKVKNLKIEKIESSSGTSSGG